MSFIVHRVTKQAARYTEAGGREKCGLCRFFVAPRSCGKVIGPVSPAGWCGYFSRQMVQQFGGSIAGIGGPSLALDFIGNPGVMPPGVTFTRASTGTYVDAGGIVRSAAINAPRWDYAGGSLRGLLIEEARTNLIHYSADISNPAWNSSNATVTGNQAIAPDGTMTAARVALIAVSGAAFTMVGNGLTGTAAPYTFSVWLRGNVGGERLYLCSTPDGAIYYRTQAILTTTWQRFSLTTPNLTGTLWYFEIGTDLRDSSQTPTPAQTVFMWGGQGTIGGSLTSYIPTLAADVTRAADLAAMPFTPAASGTYQAEFISAGSVVGLPYIVGGNAGSPVMSIGADSRLVAAIRSGASVFSGVAPALTFGAINKTAFGWLTGASKAAVNGTLLGANAVALTVTGTSMQLGSDGVTPGSNALNGTLRAVNYWPRVLSDAEMQQVTT